MLYPLAFQPEILSSLEMVMALQGMGRVLKECELLHQTVGVSFSAPISVLTVCLTGSFYLVLVRKNVSSYVSLSHCE